MTVKEILEEDLISELGKLRVTAYDAKEYRTVADTVVGLMDKKIEFDRLEGEQLFRKQQLEEERKDRLIKNCIATAGVVLPLIVTIWGTVVSLNFEKEGTITTGIGRGFINKLLPKK